MPSAFNVPNLPYSATLPTEIDVISNDIGDRRRGATIGIISTVATIDDESTEACMSKPCPLTHLLHPSGKLCAKFAESDLRPTIINGL
jgi:hypothetical protein